MIKTFHIKGRQKITFFTAFVFYFAFCSLSFGAENPKLEISRKGYNFSYNKYQTPTVNYTAHNRGNIQLAIANNGTFGTLGGSIPDPFTGDEIPSCIYPKNSDIVYLWVAAIWIGAIVGRDTLVSCGDEDWYITNEFWPDVEPFGNFEYKSIDINSPFYSEDAYSEEDIICEYTDTIDDPNIVEMDPYDNRPGRLPRSRQDQVS